VVPLEQFNRTLNDAPWVNSPDPVLKELRELPVILASPKLIAVQQN
jgi:hypothetical protein